MNTSAQKLPAPIPSSEKTSVLLVSPHQEDESVFQQILRGTGAAMSSCRGVSDAVQHISQNQPDVVICESNMVDGNWKTVLSACQDLPQPSPVLVVSRHADDGLWAEVLNLGGYDVLMKPIDRVEVSRVFGMACRQRSRAAQPQCV